VPRLATHITDRIKAEVAAFAGPRRHVHRLIHETVVVAVDAFVRLAAGDQGAYARVDEHFHALGQVEAIAGLNVEAVMAAIRLADRSVWQTIRAVASQQSVEGLVVAELGIDVSAYLKYLEARVQLGFAIGSGAAIDPGDRLVAALLQGRSGDGLGQLADDAGWQLTEHVVVVTGQRYGASSTGLRLPARTLARVDGDRTIVVTDPAHLSAAKVALLRLAPRVVVAESWPVALSQVRDAYRWTHRALALVNKGRLRPERRILDCAQHRMTLLVEADPPLVESMAAELLEPLSAEKEYQRLVLAETMLLWLETDEPASTLAKRLAAHPQTVRNRLQRIRRMFGDQLREPGQRMALIVVLNATLPRWRAERAPRSPRRRKPTSK